MGWVFFRDCYMEAALLGCLSKHWFSLKISLDGCSVFLKERCWKGQSVNKKSPAWEEAGLLLKQNKFTYHQHTVLSLAKIFCSSAS